MGQILFKLLSENLVFAAFVSIGLNIAIALIGVLPSSFITFATISFFGFKYGIILLIIGEAAGAIVSFILYRKGVSKLLNKNHINRFRFIKRLKNSAGIEAFFIVLFLRILPFVPSGVVTLTASISRMNLVWFGFASTIGKIPALIFEAYSVVYVSNLNSQWQWGLAGLMFLALVLNYLFQRCRRI